jgi:hypothetical protein
VVLRPGWSLGAPAKRPRRTDILVAAA